MPLTRGGYTVHPVPAPLSTVLLVSRRVSDGGSNQNVTLFIRGNAMSGSGAPRNFFGGGGVQQIQLRTEDRENGDLGAVAP
jgi:hypothetical protein